MSELDSILAAFGNMRVNNTEIMKQAEAAILEYMHNPSCVNSFFAILLHCDTPVVCLFSEDPIVVPSDGRTVSAPRDWHLLEWDEQSGQGRESV